MDKQIIFEIILIVLDFLILVGNGIMLYIQYKQNKQSKKGNQKQ